MITTTEEALAKNGKNVVSDDFVCFMAKYNGFGSPPPRGISGCVEAENVT